MALSTLDQGAGMTDTASRIVPQPHARLTGALYLYIMGAAMFAEVFVRGKLVVGDPAVTWRNIAASEPLWRLGVVANVSVTLCDIAVATLLYLLLRPVSRPAALTAAFFRLAYSAAMAANAVFLLGPLGLLGGAAGSGAVAAQSQTLIMYSLQLHAAGFQVALVLFGIHLALVGGLIARSTYLPRLIGAALVVAGSCYVANSVIGMLTPPLAHSLFPWLLLPGFVAEASLTLWLLIAGVGSERWARACRAAEH